MNGKKSTNNFSTRGLWRVVISILGVGLFLFCGCTDGDAFGHRYEVPGGPKEPPFSGCVGGEAITPRGEIKALEIFTLSWRVRVLQDGSGSIGFGSTAGDVAFLPAGTLDFVKWRNHIVNQQWYDAIDKKRQLASLSVWRLNGVYEIYYIDRDKIPIELFQAAIDATTHERLCKIWSEKPLK